MTSDAQNQDLLDLAANRHGQIQRLVPNRQVEGLGLREIWAYRELVFGLLHRDFVAIRNQTPMAWFWRLLQPTFTLITYTILFEHIGNVEFGHGIPYFFAMSAAMLPWQLLSSVLIGAVASISANAGFYGKVYFPRIIMPLVSVTNALVDFVVTAVLLLGILLYIGMPVTFNLLAVPFFALWALVLGLGTGLWLAGLNVLYRDIYQSLGYVIQLAFYVSPIVYPPEMIPERWRDLYHLNPVVGIVEGFRWSFLGVGNPPDINDVIAFAATCVFFVGGMWCFQRIERVLADVI